MCSARRHVRFAPKSGRNSGHRMSVKGSTSALPGTFKRRPAPLWRGRRHINAEIPHSASLCDQAKAGRRADSRCGGVALMSVRPLRRCRLFRSQSGVEQTCRFAPHMSAYDPKRTSQDHREAVFLFASYASGQMVLRSFAVRPIRIARRSSFATGSATGVAPLA